MNNWKRNTTTALAVTLGLSLALITAPVNAGSKGNKKGPQASVEVATRCTLDVYGNLDVDVIITDTSSGSLQAYVTDVEITPVYKGATKGNQTTDYPVAAGGCDDGVLVPVGGHTCVDSFDLCATITDTTIPDPLRAINTDVTVTYGIWNGLEGDLADIVGDSKKTVSNHCTDDPTTDDFEGGIYINHEELAAACP